MPILVLNQNNPYSLVLLTQTGGSGGGAVAEPNLPTTVTGGVYFYDGTDQAVSDKFVYENSCLTICATAKALVLKQLSGFSGNIAEFQNVSGTVLANITASGAVTTADRFYGWLSASSAQCTIGNPNGSPGSSSLTPLGSATEALTIQAHTNQGTTPIVSFRNSVGQLGSMVTASGYIATAKTSAPADSELSANHAALWVDATAGSAALKVKGKDSEGTVFAATIGAGGPPYSGTTLSLGTSSGGNGTIESTSNVTKGILYLNGASAKVTAAGVFSCPGSGVTSERFGLGSSANGNFSTSFGYAASAGGSSSTAFGYAANTAGGGATAFGSNANAAHGYAIAFGSFAATTAANQAVFASSSNSAWISEVYFNSVTNASPASVSLNACGGSGTNVAGANLTIAGGKGTGNAAGGTVRLQTSAAGSSGTTLQTLTDNVLCEPGQKTTIYGRLKANATFGDWGSPANLATALDASQYNNWWITLTGNYTPSITNAQDGQPIQLTFEQDATGNRTVDLSSLGTIRWVDATPTFTTTPNKFSSILLKRKGSTWIGWSLGTEV